ncbi:MAG: YcxB family protein [Oscillospiraceae bacterium]|nr:YcxB family protein [Oscillospiraceae bacterium]
MEFQIETVMNRKIMTALAKSARKTMRRKRNILIRTFGTAACILAVMSGVMRSAAGDPHGWIDLLLAACLLAFILLEDAINAWTAMRQVQPGNDEIFSVFRNDGYTNSTSLAEGNWTYDKIQAVCETKNCFVLLLGVQQGQVYAKDGFSKGSAEEFRSFISERTGKPVQYIK